MARLFAADIEAASAHALDDVAVANPGSFETDALSREKPFETRDWT
jgi:hypothetical protein